MSQPAKLWIDQNGVRRGYYVYLHKDRDTGSVFYVGKGHGRRAWSSKNRSERWKARVSSLGGDWDVEIVETGLSELDAFDLEAKLVDEYGGAFHDGGSLTNLVAGGENPMSIVIGFSLGVGEAELTDVGQSARWSRDRQKESAIQIRDSLMTVEDEICGLLERRTDGSEDADDLETLVGSALDNGPKEFLRRRISWPEFCVEISGMVEDLNEEEYGDEEVERLRRSAVDLGSQWMKKIREPEDRPD